MNENLINIFGNIKALGSLIELNSSVPISFNYPDIKDENMDLNVINYALQGMISQIKDMSSGINGSAIRG